MRASSLTIFAANAPLAWRRCTADPRQTAAAQNARRLCHLSRSIPAGELTQRQPALARAVGPGEINSMATFGLNLRAIQQHEMATRGLPRVTQLACMALEHREKTGIFPTPFNHVFVRNL